MRSVQGILTTACLGLLLVGCFPEKEKTRRVGCMENLVVLGRACHAYADGHRGSFPSNWQSLATSEVAPSRFICRGQRREPGAMGDVDSWADYVIVPGVMASDPSGAVLAYDQPSHHRGDGAPVLHVDGSVSWEDKEELGRLRTKDDQPLKME